MIGVLQSVQLIGIVAIIILMIYICTQHASKELTVIEIALTAVLIATTAYIQQFEADTLEEELICVKLGYLGREFIAWLYFVFYIIYMKKKCPRVFIYAMGMVHTAIYIFILTMEQHSLFYKNIQYITTGSFPYLEYEGGVLYYLHLIIVGIYVEIMVGGSIVYAIKRKKDIHGRIIFGLLATGIVSMAGVIIHLLDLDKPYDVTTLMIELGTLIFAVIAIRYKIFETVEIAKENVIENLHDGIIVLSSNFEILYYNAEAQRIFPGVSDIHSNDINIIRHFCSFMEENYNTEGKFYDVQISELITNKVLTGYTVTLTDITEHIEHTKHLEDEVAEKAQKITQIQERLIVSFANMIELRDDVTGQHVKRTSAYVKILANELKNRNIYPGIITDEFVNYVCKAAPLHDLGKIAISDSVLKKPGKLTDEEFETIKTHPKVGGDMLREALNVDTADKYLKYAYEMAMYHHEKWDGTGYPEGLKGTEIPLSARIMAVADVFDALTSKRSYKDKISDEDAFKIIQGLAGSHFDPLLAKIFVDVQDEIIKIKD